MSIVPKFRRIIGVLLACAALAGCSAVKFGYDSLPQLSYWWLDSWFDFGDAQSPRVREELARLHRWHRARELPQYAGLLLRMEQLAPGEVTPAQACTLAQEARSRLAAVAAQAEPAVAAQAQGLSSAQLEHLRKRFERSNDEFRRDWLAGGPQALRERRIKQLTERFERVYGRLDEAQRAALHRQVEASAFDPRQALAERLRRQAAVLEALARLQSPTVNAEQARREVGLLMAQALASPDPAARAWQEALLQEGCALVAAVHNAAAPAQRQQAASRLAGWRRDLSELAAR